MRNNLRVFELFLVRCKQIFIFIWRSLAIGSVSVFSVQCVVEKERILSEIRRKLNEKLNFLCENVLLKQIIAWI